MPHTMVHLLIAHEIEPSAPALYWVGNFAPDFSNDRSIKDAIHFRNTEDRWKTLEKMYFDIDKKNYFELGWLLHLFVDICWEEKPLIEYKNWFETTQDKNSNWFLSYRNEMKSINYYLYNNQIWVKDIMQLIKNVNLSNVITSLPINSSENEWYRNHVVQGLLENKNKQNPIFFNIDSIQKFSVDTVNHYKQWLLKIC